MTIDLPTPERQGELIQMVEAWLRRECVHHDLLLKTGEDFYWEYALDARHSGSVSLCFAKDERCGGEPCLTIALAIETDGEKPSHDIALALLSIAEQLPPGIALCETSSIDDDFCLAVQAKVALDEVGGQTIPHLVARLRRAKNHIES